MREVQIKKPSLNATKALKFAAEDIKNENEYVTNHEDKIIASKALKSSTNARIFSAPHGDKRLTINIKKELHKKLKIAAIENETSIGEIIERLVKNNL